jgi:hypothetical protein
LACARQHCSAASASCAIAIVIYAVPNQASFRVSDAHVAARMRVCVIGACPGGSMPIGSCSTGLDTCPNGYVCQGQICCRLDAVLCMLTLVRSPTHQLALTKPRPIRRHHTCTKIVFAAASGSLPLLTINSACQMNNPQQCVGYSQGLSTCMNNMCTCQPTAYRVGLRCVRRRLVQQRMCAHSCTHTLSRTGLHNLSDATNDTAATSEQTTQS